jgi:PAS domain S-box-containing protein
VTALGESQLKGLGHAEIQQFLLYDAVDTGPALIFVADEEMQYLAVNKTACDRLGYSREELLGLRVTDLVEDADASEVYAEMVQQRTAAGTATLHGKSGQRFLLTYQASAVRVAGLQYFVSMGFASPE